jgi:hypothetical protein
MHISQCSAFNSSACVCRSGTDVRHYPGEHPAKPRRRPGRPKHADAPIIPWEEVDRLLVFGEAAKDAATGREAVRFPSLAELAEHYGVSRNRMWQYASKVRCFARREEARLKTQETYERKVIEKVASSRALATADVAGIVDSYISGFRQALDEGKVRVDSPADLDRLVRLKELLAGNADSRSELRGQLTLATSSSSSSEGTRASAKGQ